MRPGRSKRGALLSLHRDLGGGSGDHHDRIGQRNRGDGEIEPGRLERVLHLAEDDEIARDRIGRDAPQMGLLLLPEPEKAEAIDGSTDNCWPTVRAIPMALAQLSQTVPVAVPLALTVTSSSDPSTARLLPL